MIEKVNGREGIKEKMSLKVTVRKYTGKSNMGLKIHNFLSDIRMQCYKCISDKAYLRIMYYKHIGKKLDIDAPKTFNEKIQWLKLNDRNELYGKLADKYKVREFVKAVCRDKVELVPLIGAWDNPSDIDFSALPESFVLKCNHNSGKGMYICKNKGDIDKKIILRSLKKGFKENYFWSGREWQYRNIDKKVLAEKYMEGDSGNGLEDYKVFVFNGKAMYIQVDYNRFTDHGRNFYDLDWRYVPFTTLYPTNPEYKVPRPCCLHELTECAELLTEAAGTPPFLRVDFYIIKGKIYFGEITFHHGSGVEPFYPPEYDEILGKLIILGD